MLLYPTGTQHINPSVPVPNILSNELYCSLCETHCFNNNLPRSSPCLQTESHLNRKFQCFQKIKYFMKRIHVLCIYTSRHILSDCNAIMYIPYSESHQYAYVKYSRFPWCEDSYESTQKVTVLTWGLFYI